MGAKLGIAEGLPVVGKVVGVLVGHTVGVELGDMVGTEEGPEEGPVVVDVWGDAVGAFVGGGAPNFEGDSVVIPVGEVELFAAQTTEQHTPSHLPMYKLTQHCPTSRTASQTPPWIVLVPVHVGDSDGVEVGLLVIECEGDDEGC